MPEPEKNGFKLDITSSVIEKSIDLAKDFLSKLIGPAIEEAGLLIKDQMTYWKFKNQVQILTKAKKQCEKYNISPKHISLKLICPLLDNCALEEDEYLQDKWANLLANMVDSEQNIDNHVFPYILGQISKDEFFIIENLYNKKQREIVDTENELQKFLQNKEFFKQELRAKIDEIENQILITNQKYKYPHNPTSSDLYGQKRELEKELTNINHVRENILRARIKSPTQLSGLEEFEISNLTRLGLAKEVQEVYSDAQTLEIPNDPDQSHLTFKFTPDVYSNTETIFTDLGLLFLKACNDKQ
jgi:hypothetical protein